MSATDDHELTFVTLAELVEHLGQMEKVTCEMDGLSELAHGLQCADVLKVVAPLDVELQVAGLVHDVGSLHSHERDHGYAGAQAVRKLLGPRIAALVGLHVDAKRYLVASDAAYRAQLSAVSIKTLEHQGMAMTAAQEAAFEKSQFFHEAICLRKADDLAKIPRKSTSSLGEWLPVLEGLCRATG